MSRFEVEEKISEFWEKNKLFEKSVNERPLDKQYVFYDGPPFATGLPHYGHILGLTSKDVFPRYWTMKGKRVERRWGWDCHGLPVENIAEKELGIKDKKEIEVMGVAKFNEFCRSKVLFFAGEWKKTVRKMGKWIEFDDSYKTMDNTYMESVWSIFKTLYDKGYIYEGKKILLYCPRCQTPLANSEIAMDNSYKSVTEKTATVAFKIKGKTDEYFLAWTTTPWTLIGNVALAINPELDYAKIDVFGKKFILAKSLVEKFFAHYELLEEFKGKKILGIEYEPLYEVPTGGRKGFYVIDGGKEVTSEEGTGIVHMAIYGEFDYAMIKKLNLPVVQHVGNDGKLILGPEVWRGKWFKKIDSEVIGDLQDRGQLIEAKDYTHSYPFCYRCETPLIYNAVDSWFVDIQKAKPRLIERAKEINWYPENIKEGRFKNILDTAPDWSISRNRFWATAIPVWRCNKCKKIKVVGSVAELRKLAIEKLPSEVDLHKHVVDEVHLRCDCKEKMNRIPEVLDCWFESGSVPYAAKHYPFENEEWFKENFPCDFVSEYIAQVRAWFYYMHVLSVLLFDKAPFKNVVVSGTVLASDGTKMSKSKGNFPDPNDIFKTYGADSLRLYLMSSALMRAEDLNFIEDNVKEMHRKVVLILSNVKNFYDLFSAQGINAGNVSSKNILDKWMISRTNSLVKNATEYMDDYNTITLCAEIVDFADDLSTWFVRRSRDRFKSDNSAEKKEAINTLSFVLDNLSKVMAPIAPFISEEIYQSLRKSCVEMKESVHLESWPKYDAKLISEEINSNMKLVRGIVSKALDERKKANIPVRQALSKLSIPQFKGVKLTADYLDLIKDELNVKEVVVGKEVAEITSTEYAVVLDTKLTPDLLREGISREFIRKVNDARKEMKLTIKDKISVSVEVEDKNVKDSLTQFASEIKQSVQAVELKVGKVSASKPIEFEIQKAKVKLGISVL
ncbi:Isoleucine--tRNA ligase [uncultured archaeon]|nr:Isoleucine--tRNA ligase [uncultured archaeon]